jgi:hypothetical protein
MVHLMLTLMGAVPFSPCPPQDNGKGTRPARKMAKLQGRTGARPYRDERIPNLIFSQLLIEFGTLSLSVASR